MSVDPPSDNNDKPNDIGPDGEKIKESLSQSCYPMAPRQGKSFYNKNGKREHGQAGQMPMEDPGKLFETMFGGEKKDIGKAFETNTTEEERETMKAEWSAKQQANSATQPATIKHDLDTSVAPSSPKNTTPDLRRSPL
ncbi:hypothetical protein Pst134EA_025990 [Puccinia striiformis f. sp. tritici]|uniref:hypothetical protein n=1 Tax=Puccinia striiformis f. sp. tritici TaxID=168172 RepID=UPI002007815C|nr:hypothetical protein Pst134EA_025990 [Puccinia striiformis f. sp. tritici]KAH9452054.1 hypothetical protein Pst134EA_025990 [Puccinia striiformis f. sp. tritici]